MMDQSSEAFQSSEGFRINVAERLTRLESRVCAIAVEINKNTELTADVVNLLRGMKAMGKMLIFAASVLAAAGIVWAAFRFLIQQSL